MDQIESIYYQKLHADEMILIAFDWVKTIVGKGENAVRQHAAA